MDPRIPRIERYLTPRNARLTLFLLGLLTVVFAIALRNVKLDHDFERFFPTDDPELDRYLEFRERFGNDNDFLLIAAERPQGVFQREFLTAFDSLAERLRTVPDVNSVTSPTSLSDPRITPVGVFQVPWLRLDADSTLAPDSARIWQDERVRNTFFDKEGKAVLMIMQTEQGLSKERSDALMLAVDQAVSNSGLERVRMGGRIHGQYWYIQKMQYELVLFFSLSVALLAVFLAVGFRTLWGVLVPIGVVGLTVLWQVGAMTLVGKPLGILTMLLPTILFVVGMSDVVHILERYIEALRNGHTKSRALAISYHEVGLATFLTSLTTAIGFATLLTSGIGPVREFGVVTAAGVFMAFGLSFTLLPAVLLLVATPVQAQVAHTASFWHPLLHGLYRTVLRKRRMIPYAFLVLALVSSVFISRLKVDNYLLEDWPEDDPQKQEYYWFEAHFGGVRPYEMEVRLTSDSGSLWDLPNLQVMEQVQQHLEQVQGVQAVISPVTVMKALNKAFNGGSEAFYRLPDDEADARRLAKRATVLAGKDALNTVITADGRHARLSGRMLDEGGHVHGKRNLVLDVFLAEVEHDVPLDFQQTGMAYLIDRSNAKLSSQLIGGLSIAFVLIALLMAWVFRSWRMTLIALVPNVVPLIFVGGIMGMVGIDIKVSTAIIFTIAFGIAVDDTIHMLGKLRIELMKGRSLPYAMKRSFLSAGKALLITSVMLLSGFISLVFSDFASVFHMGLLVSITLFMALVADLLLLPVLVLRYLPRDRS
ncbi:MAG: MMPL family transporter [Flavobacteriales bacterium]|nr:MMPL family transporter [Flavobacteriales bacterium]